MNAAGAAMPITVRLGDTVETWALAVVEVPRMSCEMRLEAPDGRTWTAAARDVWGCLFLLRRQVEPEGVRVCCQGSRRDAWATGLLRDSSDGHEVFLYGRTPADGSPDETPAVVDVLAPAPTDEVVSINEQFEWVAERLGWGEWRPALWEDDADG